MVALCNLRSGKELEIVAESVCVIEDNYMMYC